MGFSTTPNCTAFIPVCSRIASELSTRIEQSKPLNTSAITGSATGSSTAAVVCENATDNGSRLSRMRAICSQASRHVPSMPVAARYSNRPASVGVTSLLALRTNSGAPTMRSSWAMRDDTVDCETLSSSAANVNWPIS